MMAVVDVCVLGGGAAGLMCAAEASKRGRSVVVVEHAEKVGKKILISGGGRCNFTNIYARPQNYLSSNPHFCTSALARYTAQDFIKLVESHGIAYHEKTLGQLFCNGSAREIVSMLERECRAANVSIHTGCSITGGVEGVQHTSEGFTVSTTQGVVRSQSLVVATGGPSIPKMGATGFGYDLARKFELSVIPTKPALVPLTTDARYARFHELSGLSFDTLATCNGTAFRENILFTHKGLSGPAVLQASSYWSAGDAITVNALPDWSVSDVEHFFREHRTGKSLLKNALASVLPQRFVESFCAAHHYAFADKSFHSIQQRDFMRLVGDMQTWQIFPNGTEGYAKAEVTAGGVDTNELSQKNLESKKVRGLYFIGECVDVTGWLGGYNFQWAWASGVAAGQSA
jgi:predicted Rossmann fold flavoprotein